jgi:hypothetical protein
MKKLNHYFTIGIILCLFFQNAFSQNVKNKSAEDFGISIFYSIRDNNFNEFIKFLPVIGDTVSYLDESNKAQKVVINDKMINEMKDRFKFSFQIVQDDLLQEMKSQNIDKSQVVLEQITTEFEVNDNMNIQNVGIEIFLNIRVRNIRYTIRIEDNIKTNNGYFLFDNLKIKSKV